MKDFNVGRNTYNRRWKQHWSKYKRQEWSVPTRFATWCIVWGVPPLLPSTNIYTIWPHNNESLPQVSIKWITTSWSPKWRPACVPSLHIDCIAVGGDWSQDTQRVCQISLDLIENHETMRSKHRRRAYDAARHPSRSNHATGIDGKGADETQPRRVTHHASYNTPYVAWKARAAHQLGQQESRCAPTSLHI